MRMEALGLRCETEPAAASAKEIRSIGNADLQRIRNMTASTHTLGKGFLNLLKEWQKDYISCIYIYVRMSVCSSKKQSAASARKYLLRITEIFIELVTLFKQLYFPAGDPSCTNSHPEQPRFPGAAGSQVRENGAGCCEPEAAS